MVIMTDDIAIYKNLHSNIEKELKEIQLKYSNENESEPNGSANSFTKYLILSRLSTNIEKIRMNTYKSQNLKEFNGKLYETDKTIQDLIFDIEYKISNIYQEQINIDKAKRVKEFSENITSTDAGLESGENNNGKDFDSNESIETLRSRLLATSHSQLDSVQTTEFQNNYHDSIQQELIESLPSMVTSIKEQALQFQELLKQDATIIKEASENFEKSHGKFNNVNSLLSKYHSEGKLGLWFYIRIIGMVVLAFFFLLFLIRLIPARY